MGREELAPAAIRFRWLSRVENRLKHHVGATRSIGDIGESGADGGSASPAELSSHSQLANVRAHLLVARPGEPELLGAAADAPVCLGDR